MIKKIILCCSLFSISILPSTSAFAARSDLSVAGDITQILVPLAALGVATYKGDHEGQKEFAKSFITNLAVVYAFKFAFKDTDLGKRPNGGKYSFPSGHSASAFSGAFFLQKRYGFEYGAPALAAAAFTGYTRVKGKYHHVRDVIGGAAIAFGANYFFVTKYNNETVKLSTDLNKDSAILNLKMNL
jgi:membrane-associated phospholipid phosphatase